MNMTSKWILVSAVVSLAAFLCMTVGLPVVQGSADHVRWDIINFNAATTPPTVSAGGFAIAAARNNPSTLTIKQRLRQARPVSKALGRPRLSALRRIQVQWTRTCWALMQTCPA